MQKKIDRILIFIMNIFLYLIRVSEYRALLAIPNPFHLAYLTTDYKNFHVLQVDLTDLIIFFSPNETADVVCQLDVCKRRSGCVQPV